ncbi:hypothetical protein SAMN04489729_6616 [Amycolatopsis lurida]|uniref:Uncharacterized protein n=1 Tax=Amycolatopsis lurida NRRL 2430 TaxID=1460371 RepID=A0A2P2FPC8_AMYLU|nr:hypothetical protein [Amycolatopsis lurida]KFU78575.1 hypothetical protein BB31_24250 [Amycolatopsis lurida NRRL 2430]SEE18530.1 hypothetical protein SAMN04489729_6616 [Amycolatopsis lurida]
MTRFNVNAARAQRLEVDGTDWEFELDDEVFRLPREFPRAMARKLSQVDDNDVDGLLEILLGEEQYERFDKHLVTVQDVAALLEAYGKETGLPLGEG